LSATSIRAVWWFTSHALGGRSNVRAPGLAKAQHRSRALIADELRVVRRMF